jgi:hypothetical protein
MGEKREALLLAKYLEENYIYHQRQTNVPLGMVDAELIATFGLQTALRMGIKQRPMIDVIVWDNKTLLLIEAKIRGWIDGLAKLPLYNMLLDETPELSQYADWPRKMLMVIPYTNNNMRYLAKRLGIHLVEFSTPEIDKYMTETLPYYQTADYKRKRSELTATQRALGVEKIDGM